MILFEVHLECEDEIHFEVDDEEEVDFEDLKIFLVEHQVEDEGLNDSIWKICFEICDDNTKQGKNQKKNLLV